MMIIKKRGLDKRIVKFNKKGLSQVVTTVILIALALAAVAVVWVVVNNLVNKKLSEAGTCADIIDKVELNSMYSCYNTCERYNLDGDGTIGYGDYGFISTCIDQPVTGNCQKADLNGDGTINAADGEKMRVDGCFLNSTKSVLQVSVNVKDIDLDDILVSIAAGGSSNSFNVKRGNGYVKDINELDNVNNGYGKTLNFPAANSGRTYIINLDGLFSKINVVKPDSIKITPYIGEENCGAVDTLVEIANC